jgi:hypothetical protein
MYTANGHNLFNFLMLPLPAGEGWGGGSKVKIMPVGSITDLKFRKKYHLCQDKYFCYHQYFYNKSIYTSIYAIIFSLFIIFIMQ